jgi:hypothetical protein
MAKKKEIRTFKRPKENFLGVNRPNGRPLEWTEEIVREIADFIKEEANKEETLTITQIYSKTDFGYAQSAEWMKKYDFYLEAMELAYYMIGTRRELGALKGEFDSAIVRSTHGRYDPAMKAYLKEMKQVDDANKVQNIQVILSDSPKEKKKYGK